MDVREGYDLWAEQYDGDENRTRDLEGVALRDVTAALSFRRCLEVGCGTGKNTGWLAAKGEHVTAVDLSSGMLARARANIRSEKVVFRQADITRPWDFAEEDYDLVTFSLVLEHISSLPFVFQEAARNLREGGHLYLGELHPCRQYAGSKARFIRDAQEHVLPCFVHHVSDFIEAARAAQLRLVDVAEYFDEEERKGIPRILAITFGK